jgi:hypothetical protein
MWCRFWKRPAAIFRPHQPWAFPRHKWGPSELFPHLRGCAPGWRTTKASREGRRALETHRIGRERKFRRALSKRQLRDSACGVVGDEWLLPVKLSCCATRSCHPRMGKLCRMAVTSD